MSFTGRTVKFTGDDEVIALALEASPTFLDDLHDVAQLKRQSIGRTLALAFTLYKYVVGYQLANPKLRLAIIDENDGIETVINL